MPIYEYLCGKCGHDFEVLQKVSDAALRKCPACGALRLKKRVSKPTFRLKGTGWYETDFKKDGKRLLADSGDGAHSSESGAADVGDGGGKKAESEAGAKTEAKKAARKPTAAATGSTGATAD